MFPIAHGRQNGLEIGHHQDIALDQMLGQFQGNPGIGAVGRDPFRARCHNGIKEALAPPVEITAVILEIKLLHHIAVGNAHPFQLGPVLAHADDGFVAFTLVGQHIVDGVFIVVDLDPFAPFGIHGDKAVTQRNPVVYRTAQVVEIFQQLPAEHLTGGNPVVIRDITRDNGNPLNAIDVGE